MSDEWAKLVNEILGCRKCRLHATRKNAVPGEGNTGSPVIFVGEAPGAREDELGRPFVGAAGQLLTDLLKSIGYGRSDVYITNLVKCRPPNNRDPMDDEVEACSPYLIRQIQLIKPKVIVALGRHSARFLFGLAGLKWTSMSREHGKAHDVRILGLSVKLVATFHPASALYNPQLKGVLEKDFKSAIKPLMDEAFGKSKKRDLFSFLDGQRGCSGSRAESE